MYLRATAPPPATCATGAIDDNVNGTNGIDTDTGAGAGAGAAAAAAAGAGAVLFFRCSFNSFSRAFLSEAFSSSMRFFSSRYV